MCREIPPTAGVPLRWADLLRFCQTARNGASLDDDFSAYLRAPSATVTCSGTSAFYLILESLKRLSRKTTVVLPAYLCPLLPLAVRRAGLRVALCDVGRGTWDFHEDALQELCARHGDVLAIVAVHLAGIPANLDAMQRIARAHGAFVIEDCAQALGARYREQRVGQWGDFAFFSLSRGKGITMYEGGIAVARSTDHAALLASLAQTMMPRQPLAELLKLVELCGYGVCYRPQLLWPVYRLPQLFWAALGQPLRAAGEQFSLQFPLHRVSRARRRFGQVMFLRLEESIEQQRRTAAAYFEALREVRGVTCLREAAGDRATYPYVAVLCDEPSRRTRALARLRAAGLGASLPYVGAITAYEYLRPWLPEAACPNARALAERVLGLSTSTFLRTAELDAAVAILRDA